MSGKLLSDEQVAAIEERLANGIMSLRGSWRLNETRTDIDALLAHIEAMQTVREPVRWFAEQMEAKLKANEHKGGWQDCSMDWLWLRLCEESLEFRDGLATTSWLRVIEEAADVANFAMMIADKARAALAAVKEGSE